MLTIVEKVLLLKKVDLFGQLPAEELAKLAEVMPQAGYPAGETLISETDVGDALYCLIEGTARVEVGGREVARLGPGETCGEMSVFDPSEQRSATVKAITDVTVLELSHGIFNAMIEDHPEIARGVIATLSRRLRDMNRRQGGV